MIASWFVVALAFAPQDAGLTQDDLRAAAKVAGLAFEDGELKLMQKTVGEQLVGFRALWTIELDNAEAPVLGFARFVESAWKGAAAKPALARVERTLPQAARPEHLEDLAYADVLTLASLVKSKQVSCVELTEFALARLQRLDPQLSCVITLMSDRARAQAKELDAELARGEWRGVLHGIPWGAKDLLATKGARTTWGAKGFEEQTIDVDAAVVARLDRAGAVLVAKLTLGELAMGDVWFGGVTKNPWKLDQGSSGSSAGPASAVASGCVAFAIGSETCGSILSPSARCGCSSIRPTYGLVSRRGAMALSWSMDKLGPLARSVEDAAIVLEAIAGVDPLDEETIDARFVDPGPHDVKGMKVGIVHGAFGDPKREAEVEASLAALGLEVVHVDLPRLAERSPTDALFSILMAEAATAFDALTRDDGDDALVQQKAESWPNLFRAARLIPAVEYIRANRLRRRLAHEYRALFDSVDAIVHPSVDSETLVALNLTGHPSLCVPAGPRPDGTLRSIAFSGQWFAEARLVAIASAWQKSTGHHLAHPKL